MNDINNHHPRPHIGVSHKLQEKNRFDPILVADFAMKILQLKFRSTQGDLNSEPISDELIASNFPQALANAEKLLFDASEHPNDRIHAYQLFEEDSAPLSYQDISDRFKDAGWANLSSRNSVKTLCEKILKKAQAEIYDEDERILNICDFRMDFEGGIDEVLRRVEEHFEKFSSELGLERIVRHPEQLNRHVIMFVSKLLRQHISDYDSSKIEIEHLDAPHQTFIKYVCDGMSYEQFTNNQEHAVMTFDRLSQLTHYLGFLLRLDNINEGHVDDFNKLKKVANSKNDICPKIIQNLKKIGKSKDQSESKKSLTVCYEYFRARLVNKLVYKMSNDLEFREMVRGLNEQSSIITDPKVKKTLKILNYFTTERDRENNEIEHHKYSIIDLNKTLANINLNELHKKIPPHIFLEFEKFCRSTTSMIDRLYMPDGSPDSRPRIDHLISDLSPGKKHKKVRPFELFLYASQRRNAFPNGNLIQLRSSIDEKFLIYRSHKQLPNILIHHKGNSFYDE